MGCYDAHLQDVGSYRGVSYVPHHEVVVDV